MQRLDAVRSQLSGYTHGSAGICESDSTTGCGSRGKLNPKKGRHINQKKKKKRRRSQRRNSKRNTRGSARRNAGQSEERRMNAAAIKAAVAAAQEARHTRRRCPRSSSDVSGTCRPPCTTRTRPQKELQDGLRWPRTSAHELQPRASSARSKRAKTAHRSALTQPQ